MADEARYQKGLANRAKVFGTDGEQRRKEFEAACPDFARWVTENVFGDLYERKGIDDKTREAVILGILCGLGRDHEFAYHTKAALNVGMTKEDIHEIIMVCAYYAGGPNAVGASKTALGVFEEMGL